MHSGNVGHAQDLDTLLRATTLLRDLDDLSVVVIGSGARRDALQALAARISADAVTFAPFQPADVVSSSLSSADIHFVGLAHGLAGYVVPSRVYGIMAAGKADDRLRRPRERDRAARRRDRLRDRHPARPPGPRRGRDPRGCAMARHDLERMGRLGLEFAEGRPPTRSRSAGTGTLIEEITASEPPTRRPSSRSNHGPAAYDRRVTRRRRAVLGEPRRARLDPCRLPARDRGRRAPAPPRSRAGRRHAERRRDHRRARRGDA